MKKIEKKDLNKIYEGNVIIRSVKDYETFSKKGYEIVKGYISMDGCTGLTSVQFPDKVSGYIYMDEKCSETLLSMRYEKIVYRMNGVMFDKPLFDKVRHDELTAFEVLAITNMEQRRIAYEHMNKMKMKELPNFKVIHEVKNDGCGYPMKIISFALDGFDTSFYFLDCFCPSTGREYMLETRQTDCWKAKAKSFGFDSIKFDEEY